jgi:peptidoglycan hydrolase CwlO-like protein
MNRAEMKNRIKEKAEVIKQQEETIRDVEKNVTELKHRVESLSGDLKRTQAEKDAALNELAASRKMMDEASKKMDNNQQVIAWLNKQLQTGKNPSSGVVWQGATPKAPPPRHESLAAARPDVNQGSLSARSSSLSRYLPSAMPFTHGVTPDIKPASVPHGLHPSPHPL